MTNIISKVFSCKKKKLSGAQGKPILAFSKTDPPNTEIKPLLIHSESLPNEEQEQLSESPILTQRLIFSRETRST